MTQIHILIPKNVQERIGTCTSQMSNTESFNTYNKHTVVGRSSYEAFARQKYYSTCTKNTGEKIIKVYTILYILVSQSMNVLFVYSKFNTE